MKNIKTKVLTTGLCLLFMQNSLYGYFFIGKIINNYPAAVGLQYNCPPRDGQKFAINNVPMQRGTGTTRDFRPFPIYKSITLNPGAYTTRILVPWSILGATSDSHGIILQIPEMSRNIHEIHEWGTYLQHNRQAVTNIRGLGNPAFNHQNIQITIDSNGNVSFQPMNTWQERITWSPWCTNPASARGILD